MYAGPELPPGEIAIIKPFDNKKESYTVLFQTYYFVHRTSIVAIDQKETPGRFYAVKPGKHTLAVKVYRIDTQPSSSYTRYPTLASALTVLSFEAEPGHTYVVKGDGGKPFQLHPKIWIEDEQTHQVVGRYPE